MMEALFLSAGTIRGFLSGKDMEWSEVGLGNVSEESRAAIRVLADRSSFFYTRDKKTAEYIGSPKVAEATDLSFALPLNLPPGFAEYDIALALAPAPGTARGSIQRLG